MPPDAAPTLGPLGAVLLAALLLTPWVTFLVAWWVYQLRRSAQRIEERLSALEAVAEEGEAAEGEGTPTG